MPGLDPILKTTDDPRLLGPDRIVQRNRLKVLGVDFPAQDCRPTLLTIIRSHMHDKFRIDLVREISFTEISSTLGIATTFRHPEFFFLEQSLYELPGGFVYIPARDIGNRNVDLFIENCSKFITFRCVVILSPEKSLDNLFVEQSFLFG